MNRKVSLDAFIRFRKQLTDDELRALVTYPKKVKKFLGALLAESAGNTFVEPLDDKDVPERLQLLVGKYRRYAAELGYSGPIAWRVKTGFTLKKHAPLAGPCLENFKYLQNWKFTDKPTEAGIAFWVPRLAPESMSKTVEEQTQLLSALRTRLELPKHHMNGFGSVALVAGLTLANFKRTGERVPLDCYWVRTDTRDSDGRRLGLGYFGDGGLAGYYWRFGEDGNDGLGAFALGVELGG